MAAVELGQVLQDTYRITRLLGKGGMGVVYEAEHLRLKQRRLAVKVLHPSFADNAEAFERFRREAEIVSALGHPHILYVLDFNQLEGGSPYMVMELLEGEDLKRRLRRGPLAPRQLAQLLTQAGSALQLVHSHGVVHRDLKPSNIFLLKTPGDELHIKLLDFGVSKVRHGGSIVTQDDALIGTPSYMSPEQARGAVTEIDHTTDIFSLAIITHYCLSGELPFEAPTVPGVLFCICYEDPKPLPAIPGLSSQAEAVLARAMAKKKRDRYQRVEEFAREMSEALAGAEGLAGALPTTDELTNPVRELPPTELDTVRPGLPRHELPTSPLTTLSGAAASLAPRSPQRGRPTALLLGATGVVILLAGVAFYLALGPAPEPPPPVEAAAGAQASRADARPAPMVAPIASAPDAASRDLSRRVRITLRISPATARVLLDGRPARANPLELPRSSVERELRASAPGHLPATRTFVPLEDRVLELRLAPRARPAAKPEPTARPKKKLYDDL